LHYFRGFVHFAIYSLMILNEKGHWFQKMEAKATLDFLKRIRRARGWGSFASAGIPHSAGTGTDRPAAHRSRQTIRLPTAGAMSYFLGLRSGRNAVCEIFSVVAYSPKKC
jgi:hypothetical protein